MVAISDPLSERIIAELQQVCEAWSGQKLEHTALYGIRVYKNGTDLKMHRDRPNTHIVSAILNVAQQADEVWPLTIEDHGYRTHEVTLAPGELLLYEGARLKHGRTHPLQGDFFANVFIHFCPQDWWGPRF